MNTFHIATTPQYEGTVLHSDHVLVMPDGKRFRIGAVPRGHAGRKVTQGPLIPGPWAYTFGASSVIAANPEHGTYGEIKRNRAAGIEHDVVEGDLVVIDGVTYAVMFHNGFGKRIGRCEFIDLVPVISGASTADHGHTRTAPGSAPVSVNRTTTMKTKNTLTARAHKTMRATVATPKHVEPKALTVGKPLMTAKEAAALVARPPKTAAESLREAKAAAAPAEATKTITAADMRAAVVANDSKVAAAMRKHGVRVPTAGKPSTVSPAQLVAITEELKAGAKRAKELQPVKDRGPKEVGGAVVVAMSAPAEHPRRKVGAPVVTDAAMSKSQKKLAAKAARNAAVDAALNGRAATVSGKSADKPAPAAVAAVKPAAAKSPTAAASKTPCAKCGRQNSTGRDCRDTDACKNRVTAAKAAAAPAPKKAEPAKASKKKAAK